MGLIEVLGGHPNHWLAGASLSLGALSTPLQMAHESTVEHSHRDSGDVVTALPPWLAQRGDPGQQVGDRNRGAEGHGHPATLMPLGSCVH